MPAHKKGHVLLALFSLLVTPPLLSALQLDPTFGTGGKVFTGFGLSSGGEMAGFGIQTDGKILVAGSREDGGVRRLVLARYTAHGVLDTGFGVGGFAEAAFSQSLYPSAAVLQADGKMVVAGSGHGSASVFFAARFLPNGDLDASFGASGLATADFPGLDAWARALAIEPDGRLVVAGSVGPYPPAPSQSNFAAVRFNVDGSLDTSFGAGGRVEVDMGGTNEGAYGVVVEAGGRVVLGGSSNGPGGNGIALTRLLADGSVDPSFGGAGRVWLTIGDGSWCGAITFQTDGKIVAGGGTFSGSDSGVVAVVRLTSGGVLDAAFGNGGVALVPVSAEVTSITTDAGGRIVVGASFGDFVLARVLPDGRLDGSVGPEGWTTPNLANGYPIAAQASVAAVQADGAVVVGGIEYWRDASDLTGFALVRYADAASPIPALSRRTLLLLALFVGTAGALVLARSR